jgi:hypothetical protein
MRVFDCFTFFNEFDMLELRLRELNKCVDVFVLVEADHTHTNIPKEFLFEQNKDRFSKWLDKIRHIKVTDMPMAEYAWTNENHQRNAIAKGLTDVEPDDLILVSDVDEIIRVDTIEYCKANPNEKWCLRMPLFQYKLNYQLITPSASHTNWGMAMLGSQLPTTTPQQLRNDRHEPLPKNCKVIDHAGWHFSWQGDSEFLKTKLISFAHQECVSDENIIDYTNPDKFFATKTGGNIYAGHTYEIVKINDYFPRTLLEDTAFLADRVLPNATHDAREFLPPYAY